MSYSPTSVTLDQHDVKAVMEALAIASAVCSDDYQYGHLNEHEEWCYEKWPEVTKKLQG